MGQKWKKNDYKIPKNDTNEVKLGKIYHSLKKKPSQQLLSPVLQVRRFGIPAGLQNCFPYENQTAF